MPSTASPSTASPSTASRPNPTPPSPPEAWPPLQRIVHRALGPLERFLHIEAASGILLLLAAGLALGWANSPWHEAYAHFWHTPVGLRLGGLVFERSLEWVVNDALMVIFFFVVGLEIRREIYAGELSEWRRAALPAAAALGGMLAPAGLYLLLAGAPAVRSGWGVPMATDIAFAVGILALLGRRVPAALRVLLLALAVIDDLGAIVVIAAFYSSGVSLAGLGLAALGLLGILTLQRVGVREKLAYVPPALVVWAGVYAAGIHPTIAGVVIGLLTPVRAWLGPSRSATDIRSQLDRLSSAGGAPPAHELSASLRQISAAGREAQSPAESLIEKLHPWVAFGIMPIFALANAGVTISGAGLSGAAFDAASGVAVGLVLGKPIGVLAACWVMLRLGLGTLPAGLGWRHLLVLGVVAGVGFTMALFVAQLAFADARLLAASKLGVLLASSAAALLALMTGRWLLPAAVAAGAATSADDAERSTEK